MEPVSPSRPERLRDDDFDVRGANNISKLEKLTTERTQRTTSRSVTSNGHQGVAQYTYADDSMTRSSSPEFMIDDDVEQRRYAIADRSDERRSRKTEQRSDMTEQRSETQVQSHGTEERRSATGEQLSGTEEQSYSTRSLSRRERNAAAAEMAYRTAGLPADIEYSRVSKRSKTVDGDRRSKPRGGLEGMEETADMIVEDAMEQAIEAYYGKKRRRKTTNGMKTGETRSLDRQVRTTTTADRRTDSAYDTTSTENRKHGRSINETRSRDDARKKAVSYLRFEQENEDFEEDLDLRRPASADGRLTNRVDFTARRRAQAARRMPPGAVSTSGYQATYTSSPTSRYQRRMATHILNSGRASGYSSETERMQPEQRQHRGQHFSGDDSDFSTTVEIRSPRSMQFYNRGYTSDESETGNLQYSSSHSRVPTLTKGMVTKILHGDPLRPPATEKSAIRVRRFDVQSAPSPIQFSTSPQPTIDITASSTFRRDGQLSAVVPVGTARGFRSTLQPSAVDDNFLLQRAAAYQPRVDAARQTAAGGGAELGRERTPSLYAAFSNEPIIVADLNDDHTTRTSMRRTQSLFALDQQHPVSETSLSRDQTPIYSSRPDVSMTNRQVLNLYLFNRRAPRDSGQGRSAEMETMTRTMTFDEEEQRITKGNKQTQTTTPLPVHRETRHYVTSQRDIDKLASPKPKPSKPRKLTPSRVTEETVIVKPSITETTETEMVGDVFADRRRVSTHEPETPTAPTARSLVTHARQEQPQEEPEEEMLETTVIEEKERRIEMTIREDLEFSLQRTRGTAKSVTGSTDEGRIEPWWIPDRFEAFVERKQQKITQTKDIENTDDHSKRIEIEESARNSQYNYDASDGNNSEDNYESHPVDHGTSRNDRQRDRNVRIPIFLESHYNSPMHGMTSPSSNLVRAKMKTHSEPEINRRHQYYISKRDNYGSLFDDSHRRPLINNENSALAVTSLHANKRQRTWSSDAPELRLEVVDDDEASDDFNSARPQPRSTDKRYVSCYSQYISPPLSSSGNQATSSGNDFSSRPVTIRRVTDQSVTSRKDAVFPTSKIISLPNAEPANDEGPTRGLDDDQLPESLDHFDRVLTEIEQEFPPPPLPYPVPPSNQQLQNISSLDSHHVTKSTTSPSTRKKSKPPPPQKSWRHNALLPPKSGKLYSSKDVHSADVTDSGFEKQKGATSRSERQSTNLKAANREIYPSSSSQHATESDFHHQLGDRSYVSLSLTQPVQSDDQRRRMAVLTRGQQHAEPGSFAYGWTSRDQKKREPTPQPGSYRLRHSHRPADDYETAATAF